VANFSKDSSGLSIIGRFISSSSVMEPTSYDWSLNESFMGCKNDHGYRLFRFGGIGRDRHNGGLPY
ncbi:hypothetical protein, partial [Aeromonas finlandensis]|uniref:hypothetical protein n=1 Tax=Aeromonas finlandensis TaxID=1543375 RepID=UPI0019D41129